MHFPRRLVYALPVIACGFLLACTGCESLPKKAPSSLPPDDPCQAAAVGKFAVECALKCKANEGDSACYAACEAEIDRRCDQ